MFIDDAERITYIGETNYRGKRTKFGIKAKDRTKHMYVIGKSGMGKSTLLENLAVQDIQNGEGMAFFDPHGGSAEKLLDYIPENRIKDVIYFAPFDSDYPISFNVMEDVGYDKRHLVADGLMSAFKKIWADAWSARMEHILNNTILALLEYPDSTLLSVNKMLTDKEYRKKVVENVTDPGVKSFWVDEFAKYTDRFAAEATPAIQNKIGQFTSNPLIRNIIGQPKSSFDLRKVMDEKKLLIVNLSKGRMGEQNANLLGSMLITKLYLSAMSRADASPVEMQTLPNFYLYVDEFQSFANDSFANILSEARKYKLNLTLAHQYIEQMSDDVRAAVFGNVGTMIVFRIGSFDAEVFEKEFSPQFTAEDMVNLSFPEIYLRLMIDNVGSQPFSAITLPPIPSLEESLRNKVIENSRELYTTKRGEVEESVKKLHGIKKDDSKKPSSSFSSKGEVAFGKKKTTSNFQPKINSDKLTTQKNFTNKPPVKNNISSNIANSKNDAPKPFEFPKKDFRPKKEIKPIENIKKVSLQELKKDNSQETGNRNALKDALADILSEAGSTGGFSSVPKTEKKKTETQGSNFENRKQEQSKPTINMANTSENLNIKKIPEVSEGVLRKTLE